MEALMSGEISVEGSANEAVKILINNVGIGGTVKFDTGNPTYINNIINWDDTNKIGFMNDKDKLSLLKEAEILYSEDNWKDKKRLKLIMSHCKPLLIEKNKKLEALLGIPRHVTHDSEWDEIYSKISYEQISNAFKELETTPEGYLEHWVRLARVTEEIAWNGKLIKQLLGQGELDLSASKGVEWINQRFIDQLEYFTSTALKLIEQHNKSQK